ncbi:Terminase-like family protein [compost metagenome]
MSAISYTPTPYGQALIQSLKKYSFIAGPVGSSKTTACLFKILYHAKRQRPNPADGIRYTRFVIVRATNRQLFDTTLKSFFQWFPPGVAGEWQATQKTFVFRFDDVYCEVLFRPLESPADVSNVLSLELTGAMIDEFVEIPREIVDAVESRTGRYPGPLLGGNSWKGVWGASNPGTQDSWWYDWLYEPWPEEEGGEDAQEEVLNFFEQPSGFSPDAENLENLPPYKPNDNTYYRELAKGKTEAWIKQFIEVQWGYSQRGKPVFKAFKRDLHVATKPLQYNPHLPILMGFDAGLTPAAVFAQQDSFGRVLILAELVSENMGAQRFCREKVKPLINRLFPGCRLTVVADPATKQRAQTDEKTVASVLEKELGVRVQPASSNTLAARLGAVDGFLTLLTEAGPALLIDPTCKNAITGFVAGYRYAINAKGVAADAPEKNNHSHLADSIQYMALGFADGAAKEARARKHQHHAVQYRNSYAY